MSALSSYLTELLQNGTRNLAGVSQRRMFGSNAFFREGKIFALEWHDRMAVKLHSPEDFAALASEPGAEPWSPMGNRPMSKWMLLPEGYHDDEEGLAEWLRRAHAQVVLESGKRSERTKKAAAPRAGKKAKGGKRSTPRKPKGGARSTPRSGAARRRV